MGFLRRHRLAEGLLLGAWLGRRRRPRTVRVVHVTVRRRPVVAVPPSGIGRGGCAAVLAVALILGVVVTYWYVVLPMSAALAVAVIPIRRRSTRYHPTRPSSRRDSSR